MIGSGQRLARSASGRKNSVYVRFDESEYAELLARAAEANVTPSAFLHIAGRWFVPPPDAPVRWRPGPTRAQLRAVHAELSLARGPWRRLSDNINQAVRRAHVDGLVAEAAVLAVLGERVVAELARLDRLLDALDTGSQDESGAA